MYQDKIRGCLIGGAAGDALGYPVEFDSDKTLFREFGREGMTDYCLTRGRAVISDDTQMTMFTANGLLRWKTAAALDHETAPLSEYIYDAYLDWLQTQGGARDRKTTSWICELPAMYACRAPGNTCLSALRSGRMGTLKEPVNNSKGCGGIMRVAPLGLDASVSAAQAFDDACDAAVITHGHIFGWMPSGILAYLVRRLAVDGMDLRSATGDCIEYLTGRFDSEESRELADWMALALVLADNEKPDAENIRQLDHIGHPSKGGWTGESALYIALYAAIKYEHDFSRAITCAVNVGEDRDSTGAVAGNLVGAAVGYDAIDGKWKEKLELRDTILTLADDLSLCGTSDPAFMTSAAWQKKYGSVQR